MLLFPRKIVPAVVVRKRFLLLKRQVPEELGNLFNLKSLSNENMKSKHFLNNFLS